MMKLKWLFLMTLPVLINEGIAHERSSRLPPPLESKVSQLCIRVKTSPDFWSGYNYIRKKDEFRNTYIVQISFNEGRREKSYSLTVPMEDGVSERACFPKGVSQLFKSNEALISNIRATIKAIPDTNVIIREVPTGSMYIPAQKMEMKDKDIIQKEEQVFSCMPQILKGPFKFSKLITDDIIISLENGSRGSHLHLYKGDNTQHASDLHDLVGKEKPIRPDLMGQVYSENQYKSITPLACKIEILAEKEIQ